MSKTICNTPDGCMNLARNPGKDPDFDVEPVERLNEEYAKETGAIVLSECSGMCNYSIAIANTAKGIINDGGVPLSAVRVNGEVRPEIMVAYWSKADGFSQR
jgi:hypothetical protein